LDARGNFYSWGRASSGATCSPLSNGLLLTGIIPSADAPDEIHQAPTVFQYAVAAGYKAYYIDTQANYLWNGLSPDDLKSVEWINVDRLGRTCEADLNAAQIIHDIVTRSTGNFIVLNKRGVHFMYEDSYPPSAAIWGPLPPQKEYRSYPALVTNPYDNGVHYTVDNFFRILLPDTNTYRNTWYIYTSDHAQTLFEDGMTWSHCNNSIKEATVPLIMIGDFKARPDTSYPASHSNILPTILDLMDFPESQILRPLNVSLLASVHPQSQRFFVDGALRVTPYDFH
jgi:glucan phosphoethanolaminetransferase (alkaline phosphatase superfamily)